MSAAFGCAEFDKTKRFNWFVYHLVPSYQPVCYFDETAGFRPSFHRRAEVGIAIDGVDKYPLRSAQDGGFRNRSDRFVTVQYDFARDKISGLEQGRCVGDANDYLGVTECQGLCDRQHCARE